MKRRRGFTLIELLAVIVILGVILVMAVPQVIYIINDNKKEALVDSARLMQKGAQSYFTMHLSKRPQQIDETAAVTLKQLVDESFIEMVTDPFHGNSACDSEGSYVIVKFLGNRKYDYYITLNCNNYGFVNILSTDLSKDKLSNL
jgi:prepilin-type N-terminal cleavage/methylation domain-containing protein